MSSKLRFTLGQADIPTHWYNVLSDVPKPLPPPLHPGTKQPVSPEMMTAIFPENLVMQEMTPERWVEIPAEVRDIYALWRPTPLLRAVRLEKALQTPAHIYYKYEGGSPAGSHKPNTAVAQAYYNKQAGTKRLATETGAGQWGSALALACRFFDLECTVYMVRVSYDQKPYRKLMMQAWDAKVFPSPSERTDFGRTMLQKDPQCPGSLGIAISEALEDTVKSKNTKYSLGSVLNHVCLHQTVVGQEAVKQMEQAGEDPDVIIACIGGGSNFAGMTFPFVRKKIVEKKPYRIVAVEPSACASLTKGELRYDFGDTAQMTPLLWMYTLGHDFIPPKIHAGGLRYHGMAPSVSHLYNLGIIDAVAYPQTKVFEAAVLFARTEGILPAPEPSHAIRAVIDEAVKAREEGRKNMKRTALTLLLAAIIGLPVARAYDLPALNLGFTSFLDGGPPAGPGWYFTEYLQFASSLPPRTAPKASASTSAGCTTSNTQVQLSPGGFIKPTTGPARESPAPSTNGLVEGGR